MSGITFGKRLFHSLTGLHYRNSHGQFIRCIYSKTGVWDKENYNRETRQEVESYWKEKLQEYMIKESKEDHGDKEKYYVLSMFPYPSGKLHMGHVRVYMLSDIIAHFHRMNGKQVLHPIGWDAFGLPAENAAIERGLQADEWTYSNINYMRKQLKDIGLCFNWEKEVTTCNPDYYRWTQFLFVKMFKAGLAYQKEAVVNWDPVDQTVLASEQVDEKGLSWRSGAKAEKRLLRQWFLKRWDYNKALVDSLKELPGWPDEFKNKQAKWIGSCDGCTFNFRLQINPGSDVDSCLRLHTPNPELIHGAAYILLAPFNSLLKNPGFLQCLSDEVKQQLKQLDKKQQRAINLGISACNPLTNQPIPIFVANDRMFTSYDTQIESALGIPSASEEEAEFARLNGIEFQPVLSQCVHENKEMEKVINSGQFSGLSRADARKAVLEYITNHRSLGEAWTSHRQYDWLVSRQRYWGTPIPIIHCSTCKEVPVPESDLPVVLPKLQSISSKGMSPLAEAKDWLKVKCPQCGKDAQRETDTMDTFVDSAWYFLRYADAHNEREPFAKDKADKWMPVDLYVGGEEHVLLHLLSARFINHFLHDQGMLSHKEPFKKLLVSGYVKGQSYKVASTGQYLSPEQVDFSGDKPVAKETGEKLIVKWEKMSKSKHNGVDPEKLITEYGVDTVRSSVIGSAVPRQAMMWDEQNLKSQMNWIHSMWRLASRFIKLKNQLTNQSQATLNGQQDEEADIEFKSNSTIEQVTNFYETNTSIHHAIKILMFLTNELTKSSDDIIRSSSEFERALCSMCIMVAPFAPLVASEMWRGIASVSHHKVSSFDWKSDVLEQQWPSVKETDTVPLIVKINNKVVGRMSIPIQHQKSNDVIKDLVYQNDIGREHLGNGQLRKVSVVRMPVKIPYINFVLEDKADKLTEKKS